MHKWFVISILVLFLASWLKPYLPYIDYAFNKDYIAKNLCENKEKPKLKCEGKCHLKKEVEKIANELDESENEPQKSPTYKLKVKNNLIDQNLKVSIVLYETESIKKHRSYLNEAIAKLLYDVATPPPKNS